MKYIGKTVFKPFEAGQKSLFEFSIVAVEKKSRRQEMPESKEGMPGWFWRLAEECKTETSSQGC